MSIKVGINGFGRIGRNIFRAALEDPSIEIVAVNDITDSKTLAHLLKYDSILGNLPNKVTHTEDTISVDGKAFKVFRVKDPAEIDWTSVGATIVVESTGLFTAGANARKHIYCEKPMTKTIYEAHAVVDAVTRCHEQGILTAASLMVGAPAAADAVARARALPSLAVGLHLALVEARPALPPEQVKLIRAWIDQGAK